MELITSASELSRRYAHARAQLQRNQRELLSHRVGQASEEQLAIDEAAVADAQSELAALARNATIIDVSL